MKKTRKTAQIYRMQTPKHICPFGLRAKDLLHRQGFSVEDNLLTSREETDAFKQTHQVKTTPQIFIADERIGGYEDLRKYLGLPLVDKKKTTYKPIIAIFATTFLLALSATYASMGNLIDLRLFMWFLAFSLAVLAIQKLRDLNAFVNQFIVYDLLAMRWLRYAWIYPFLEAFTAVTMVSGYEPLASIGAVVAIVIGLIGAVSVIKAVYIDKRELKCACVGGNSNVPLGFVSLTENVMMVVMALVWLL